MSERETVRTLESDAQTLEISVSDICPYLGLGRKEPDDALRDLILRCLPEFRQAARLRVCWLEVPVTEAADGVDLGVFFASGRSLAKNMAGCGRAILFAATIGTETELQRKRAAVTSPSRALVLDAIGTAAIESFCNALCDGWSREFDGSFLRPRFSPGYGDLPLALQRPLLSCLDSGRKAGIYLTEALLMVPQKSVTAIVGIGRTGCTARLHDCTSCDKPDCAFRL